MASFQISVGSAGTSNTTVFCPRILLSWILVPGHTCSPAEKVKPTLFPSADGRRYSQALMTWNVACVYAQMLAQRAHTCCVSYSAFYIDTSVPCPTCTCACQSNITSPTGTPT